MKNAPVSRARAVLNKLKEQDEVPAVPGDQQQADDQPNNNDTGSPSLQQLAEDVMQDPQMMGQACDTMADVADRYMDEQDQDTWTPGDDAEKQDVLEACNMMREAGMRLKRVKKA